MRLGHFQAPALLPYRGLNLRLAQFTLHCMSMPAARIASSKQLSLSLHQDT
jgi:hypothetical protein